MSTSLKNVDIDEDNKISIVSKKKLLKNKKSNNEISTISKKKSSDKDTNITTTSKSKSNNKDTNITTTSKSKSNNKDNNITTTSKSKSNNKDNKISTVSENKSDNKDNNISTVSENKSNNKDNKISTVSENKSDNKDNKISTVSENKSDNNKILSTSKKKSNNSLVALSGNEAEHILCRSINILNDLSKYFGKKIIKCEKIGGRKKSDVCITFDDNSQTMAQLKNGNGGGRGWSFDRRSVDMLPTTNDSIKELIKTVCLKSGNERKEVKNDKKLIEYLIFGNDENTKPQYFIHTTIKDNKIIALSICPALLFITTLLNEAYENCNAKKTCVHLTPLIYLQRKGGNKTDHSPNDIQAKLRTMPICMTNIKLY